LASTEFHDLREIAIEGELRLNSRWQDRRVSGERLKENNNVSIAAFLRTGERPSHNGAEMEDAV
jgi:hypothetical protein